MARSYPGFVQMLQSGRTNGALVTDVSGRTFGELSGAATSRVVTVSGASAGTALPSLSKRNTSYR